MNQVLQIRRCRVFDKLYPCLVQIHVDQVIRCSEAPSATTPDVVIAKHARSRLLALCCCQTLCSTCCTPTTAPADAFPRVCYPVRATFLPCETQLSMTRHSYRPWTCIYPSCFSPCAAKLGRYDAGAKYLRSA